MENFIGLDEYESYCGEEGSKAASPAQASQQGNTKKIRPVKHPGLKLKTPIAYQSDTDPSVIPIQKDGMGKYSMSFPLILRGVNPLQTMMLFSFLAVCQNCGAIGVKHAFYTKERRFCSLACSRGENATPVKENNEIKQEPVSNQVQQAVQSSMPQQPQVQPVQPVQPVQLQQLQMQPQMQMQQQMQVLMPQMQMQGQIPQQIPQQIQGIPPQMLGNGLHQQVPIQLQPMPAQMQMQQLPMGIPQMDQQLQLPMQMQSQVDMSHIQMNMPMAAQMQVMQTQMEVVPQVPMPCETMHGQQDDDGQIDQKPWISSVSIINFLHCLIFYFH